MSMTFLEAVDSLGVTSEEVLIALRAKGIKGYRQSASQCPIAKYLNACGFPKVTVCTSAKYYGERSQDWSEQSISLPPGVVKWTIDFDNGKYPEFYLVD